MQQARKRDVLDDRDIVLAGERADGVGLCALAFGNHARGAIAVFAVADRDGDVGRVDDDGVGAWHLFADRPSTQFAVSTFARSFDVGVAVVLFGFALELVFGHLHLVEEAPTREHDVDEAKHDEDGGAAHSDGLQEVADRQQRRRCRCPQRAHQHIKPVEQREAGDGADGGGAHDRQAGVDDAVFGQRLCDGLWIEELARVWLKEVWPEATAGLRQPRQHARDHRAGDDEQQGCARRKRRDHPAHHRRRQRTEAWLSGKGDARRELLNDAHLRGDHPRHREHDQAGADEEGRRGHTIFRQRGLALAPRLIKTPFARLLCLVFLGGLV